MSKPRHTRRAAGGQSVPLERASKALDLVARSPRGLRAVEISELLDLPQPTAYRLVRRLEKIGYLECSGRDLEYTVGPQLRALAAAIQAGQPMELVIEAVVQALADNTGMSAYLAARTGSQVALVSVRLPSAAKGASIFPGHQYPAHATASGRAILAFQGEEAIRHFLQQAKLERVTERSVTTADQLTDELAKARKNGFATVRDEMGNGLWALAAPVAGNPLPQFALGVVALASQVKAGSETVGRIARMVMQTADDLRDVLAQPIAFRETPKPQAAARRRRATTRTF
jgi:DNA-binding IclR family transcriptional regulator